MHDRLVYRLVIGNEAVKAPAVGDVALQPAEILLDLVTLVPALVGHADIARAPVEVRIRIGARCQDRAQVRRDERIGHRDRGQARELRQAAAALGAGGQVHIHELAIEVERRGDVVVGLDEGALALKPVDVIDLLADRHTHVAAHNRIAAGAVRTTVVQRAGLGEQGTVVVETQVRSQGIAVARNAVAVKQRGHCSGARRVCSAGHVGSGADEARRRLVGEERAAAAVERVLLGIGERRNNVAAIFGEAGAACDRTLELVRIAARAERVLRIDRHALERADRLEVDHARHRVRTIDRRSAAGDRIHAADDRIG